MSKNPPTSPPNMARTGVAQKLQAATRSSGLFRTKLPPLAPDPDFLCNAASVEVMENRQELELVLEGLEASVGDIPRLNLEKYATFVEEEYRLLRQQKEGEA